MKTSDLHQLGQLAEAAYAPFIYKNRLETSANRVLKILQGLTPDGQEDPDNGMEFSATQAQLFTDHWQVLAHQPDTGSGFSATLFKNQESGELVYAIRGTESFTRDLLATDIGDIVLDGLAIHQIVDLYNDWQRLTAGTGPYGIMRLEEVPYDPLDWAADDPRRQGLGLVSATTPVTAVGHPLGGHLAHADVGRHYLLAAPTGIH